MSDDKAATAGSATIPAIAGPDPARKIQAAIESLSSIIPSIPPYLSSSTNPALSLLHDAHVSAAISALIERPDSGAGDNNLCRWLYDTFQSAVPDLQLLVLRFLPLVAGAYLSRVTRRKPQAGFEAVLLALYAYETASRAGHAVTVTIPDLSHPSIYHEPSKSPTAKDNNNATGLNLAVISPSLEPHGTVRSTRRARIVGVALELYYSKIAQMPAKSKMDLCEYCKIWSGHNGDAYKDFESDEGVKSTKKKQKENHDETEEDEIVEIGGEEEEEEETLVTEEDRRRRKKEGRIPLPWELLQPILRILGHCLVGPNNGRGKEREELLGAATEACRSLYGRAMHDVNPKAILAAGSLLRLSRRGKVIGDCCEAEVRDVLGVSHMNVISL